MQSLSALKWHVNLDNMFGIFQRKKKYFCLSACTAVNVSGHTSLNSAVSEQKWHVIFVRFHFLDSRSSIIIDKYPFYCFSKAVLSLYLNKKKQNIESLVKSPREKYCACHRMTVPL